MKNLILMITLSISISGCAQTKTAALPPQYGAIVRFNSICCGPAPVDFLKNFVKRFNHEHKVTLSAFKKEGCGREGEFCIVFSFANLKEPLQTEFKKQLQELIPKANEETRLKNTNKGPVQLLNDAAIPQLDNCRGDLTTWSYND